MDPPPISCASQSPVLVSWFSHFLLLFSLERMSDIYIALTDLVLNIQRRLTSDF